MRKILRNRIREIFETQDKCAYATGIDSGILSRIINCTLDPSKKHLKTLAEALDITVEEVYSKK